MLEKLERENLVGILWHNFLSFLNTALFYHTLVIYNTWPGVEREIQLVTLSMLVFISHHDADITREFCYLSACVWRDFEGIGWMEAMGLNERVLGSLNDKVWWMLIRRLNIAYSSFKLWCMVIEMNMTNIYIIDCHSHGEVSKGLGQRSRSLKKKKNNTETRICDQIKNHRP